MNGITFSRVDTSLAGKTAIIVGGGRSLTGLNFKRLRGLGHIITINDSGKLIPFADSWFTLDPWGLGGEQLPPPNFSPRLYAAVGDDFGTNYAHVLQHRVTVQRKITFLHRLSNHNMVGQSSETAFRIPLAEEKDCISTGNSGYGAFGLAYHMRPARILLLGLDGDIGYHYTDKTANRRLTHLPKMFDGTKPQMDAAGIEVINGSLNSTITTYPRMSVEDALKELHG